MRPQAQQRQVMKKIQEAMHKLSSTPVMKKRSNGNQNNPYQKEVQHKDKISEGKLLHLFPGMDISFMGIALHVENLDTRL